MSLRAGVFAGLAIGLLAVCRFAPSVFDEASGPIDGERLEKLVARAGFWGAWLNGTPDTSARNA